MKICLKCNNRVADNKKFCDNCGGNAFRPLPKQPQQQTQPQQQKVQVQVPIQPNLNRQQNIIKPDNQPKVNQQIVFNEQENKYTEDNINQIDMTIKEWIITFILTIIPVFNIIYIIKNIKDTNNPIYKRNYFKAYGLYFIVASIISTIISVVL